MSVDFNCHRHKLACETSVVTKTRQILTIPCVDFRVVGECARRVFTNVIRIHGVTSPDACACAEYPSQPGRQPCLSPQNCTNSHTSQSPPLRPLVLLLLRFCGPLLSTRPTNLAIPMVRAARCEIQVPPPISTRRRTLTARLRSWRTSLSSSPTPYSPRRRWRARPAAAARAEEVLMLPRRWGLLP